MNIGRFQIDSLETSIFGLDGGAMFGVVPKVLWSKAYDKGDDKNRIPLQARLALLRFDDKIVLVDTGNGTKLSEKLAKIYAVDLNKSSVEKALANFNVKPQDVTDVILTHLHFDHSGGATKKIGDEIVPTFPNAKYYVQKEQYEWALNPSIKDRASYFDENYVPLKENGVLEVLDGEGEIFPGVSPIIVNGHTKGMQLIKISDGGETLLYCADLIPTSAHIPLPFVMGYDNEPLATIAEKKKILPRAREENWTLMYEHDAFIQASKVGADKKGFKAGEEVIITER